MTAGAAGAPGGSFGHGWSVPRTAGKSAGDRHQLYTYVEFNLNELADTLVPPEAKP